MKLTKRLIPAFAMLLVSAVLMSTASFAWFSMNTTVTAKGMQVTAKTDAIFLEINGANDGADYKTIGTSNVDEKLYPAAHENFTDVADVNTPGNWYYMYSDDPQAWEGVTTGENGGKTPLTAFTNYVAVTTFSVKLNENSVETAYDLYVSAIDIPANSGISVVIVGENGYQEFTSRVDEITFDANNVISDTVTQTAQTITVYIYFNGNNENVYSNNITALAGAVQFTLTASGADN